MERGLGGGTDGMLQGNGDIGEVEVCNLCVVLLPNVLGCMSREVVDGLDEVNVDVRLLDEATE